MIIVTGLERPLLLEPMAILQMTLPGLVWKLGLSNWTVLRIEYRQVGLFAGRLWRYEYAGE